MRERQRFEIKSDGTPAETLVELVVERWADTLVCPNDTNGDGDCPDCANNTGREIILNRPILTDLAGWPHKAWQEVQRLALEPSHVSWSLYAGEGKATANIYLSNVSLDAIAELQQTVLRPAESRPADEQA